MNGYDIAYEQIENYYHSNCDYVPYTTFIVHLNYKYDCEENYTNAYEIMSHGDDSNLWLNDWCEGQTDVIVKGIIDIEELPPSMFHEVQKVGD